MSNSTGTGILTMTSVGPAAWTSTSSVALSPRDARYALKKAGVLNFTQFPTNTNYPKRRDELIKHYSQVPPEWIMELGRVYRSSFEMFGYPFPGPLKVLLKNDTGQTGNSIHSGIAGQTGNP